METDMDLVDDAVDSELPKNVLFLNSDDSLKQFNFAAFRIQCYVSMDIIRNK